MTALAYRKPFVNTIYNTFNNNNNNKPFNKNLSSSQINLEYNNIYDFKDDLLSFSFPFHYDQCKGQCSICSLEDKMERSFCNSLFKLTNNEPFSPKIKINENERYYSIKMEVPGIRKNQIKININEKDRIISILRNKESKLDENPKEKGIDETEESNDKIKEIKKIINNNENENVSKENELKEVEKLTNINNKFNNINFENNYNFHSFEKSFFIPKDVITKTIKVKIIKNERIKIIFDKKKK